MNKASESKIGNKNPAWKGGPVERTCQTCGNIFLVMKTKIPGHSYADRTRAKSKYCSRECFSKSQIKDKIEKICQICKIIFYVISAKADKAKYCSRKCKHQAQTTKIIKECLVCKNDFEVIMTRNNTAKYCSVECFNDGLKHEIPIKECEYCNKALIGRNAYAVKLERFCSRECHSLSRVKTIEHHKEIQAKHDHLKRARKHGAEGYFTEDEWALLKRQYHHRCLCCGRQEPDIKLTKDHIVPLSKGGTNWIANIQPLCRSCNSKKHNRIIKYSHVDNDYRYERSNINGLRRDFD